MKSTSVISRFILEAVFLTVFLLIAQFAVLGQDNKWRPVSPQELSSKTPVVEPDADAEAIFWEVRVDDSATEELALQNYVRVKIFTERGRELYAKHDVIFGRGTRIKDVEARVTKPDGSVVLLKKEDVFDREIAKANGIKVKAKSFALPGLEIGSIVEYRYREMIGNVSANMRLIFQRDIPLQSVSYWIKPFSGTLEMGYERFNVGDTNFEKEKNGFYIATMTNVPAFREEPSMLPEDEVKKWIYIYYRQPGTKNPQEFWKGVSKTGFEASKGFYKVSDEVKTVTAQVVAGATTDEEKLHKIYDYTKTEIKNLSYSEKVTDDEWKKVQSAKSGSETLKLKMGSAADVDYLFGSMARAAGFDARLAFSGDRSELFFNPRVMNERLMLNSSSVAVKVGSDWRFFSPASRFVPFGMLGWVEENQTALISDPKELIWKETPLSPSEKSMEKRSGKFKLLEDGTLEGEARMEFSGNRGASHKSFNLGDSAAEREKTLKELVQSNILGSAEIDNISIENVSDPEKPFVYIFKIRVPGYASRTGKRIFLQPNVFERNSKPRFTATARKYDVYIQYPYSEQDDLTIELPAGFALENAESPATIKDQQGIGFHETNISISSDKKMLVYSRKFSFGNGGFIRFPVASYPAIKGLFEAFNKADVHQLTLRQIGQ